MVDVLVKKSMVNVILIVNHCAKSKEQVEAWDQSEVKTGKPIHISFVK